MPCTKCGSQDHSRDNCRWPGVLLFVSFAVLFLIVGPAIALESLMVYYRKTAAQLAYKLG